MLRIWAISVIALSFFTTTPQAQAQSQAQRDIALDLIGGAIGGGLIGVAGVLTRVAIEDAMRRPSYGTPPQGSAPTSPAYSYSFPGQGRSGVLYNQPCSSFDPSTGRLPPCQIAAASPVISDPGNAVRDAARPHPFAAPAYAPHVRASHTYRNPRIHVRTVHISRGGHR